MSRLPTSGPMSSRAMPNVYTGLAFISMLATLGALVYMLVKFMGLGLLGT